MGQRTAVCLVAAAAEAEAEAAGTPPSWDVVVYGSSPAGIAAATAAGLLGLKTALYVAVKV